VPLLFPPWVWVSPAVVVLADRLPVVLRLVRVRLGRAQHDPAVDRKRLQDNIKTLLISVGEKRRLSGTTSRLDFLV
jgi:hypothetical protein